MSSLDLQYLRLAAHLALRGHGGAEPNPLVGCVIVSSEGFVVGWGYHRKCGEEHAEIHALRRAGSDLAKGATVYVTLEPCNHEGRTGPCAEAIIKAGIARVVIGRADPHPEARGGANRLRAAGLEVVIIDDCSEARAVSEPFVHRVNTGLPWVVAKWAQTVDGKIATRTGASQWISGERSRRMVHRERGRVDAILTGIGTVLKDDPQMTARGVRLRRIARRVVIDPKLQIPLDCRLVKAAGEIPLTIACHDSLLEASDPKGLALRNRGVEILGMPMDGGNMRLKPVLQELVSRHETATVLVEAGAGLLSRLFRENLVNEAWVFLGPLLLGDEQAASPMRGMVVSELTDGVSLQLRDLRRRGDDVMLRYGVGSP